MAMPKQVEQAIREVEELEKQLQAQQAQQEPEAEAEQQIEPAPETAEVEPTLPVEPVAQEVDWQQKYRTLQGMYDADVPRLHTQVKELTQQLHQMQLQMEAKPAPTETREHLVTDADKEAFGEDLIDLQRRIAQEVAGHYDAKLSAYESKIEALERRLLQTGDQVGTMTFEQKLHRAIPDFADIDADPRWIAWLDSISPDIRAPRRLLAEQAYKNGDIEGVVHYVNLFRSTLEPAAKPDKRQSELNRQVAPSRAASGNASVTPQGKQYTMGQWGALYDTVAKLYAKGSGDEAQKLEAELNAAMTQGRVSP